MTKWNWNDDLLIYRVGEKKTTEKAKWNKSRVFVSPRSDSNRRKKRSENVPTPFSFKRLISIYLGPRARTSTLCRYRCISHKSANRYRLHNTHVDRFVQIDSFFSGYDAKIQRSRCRLQWYCFGKSKRQYGLWYGWSTNLLISRLWE